MTTYFCRGAVKYYYLDWDGSRYTVSRQATITLNVEGTSGYVMMDLGREPLNYSGPLYLDGGREHVVTLNEASGDHMYFNLQWAPNHTLTFWARFTNRNNIASSGVYPSTIDCK